MLSVVLAKKFYKDLTLTDIVGVFLYAKEGEELTFIKCDRRKCFYNAEGICEHRKIVLKYGRCVSFTRDKPFTVKDLVHYRCSCHKENGKYKNNQGRVFK